MIDFNSAGTQRPEQMNVPDPVEGDPVAAFLSKMAKFNLSPGSVITDGTLQRFDTDKKGNKAGWYVYHSDSDFPGGAFGNWQEDLSEKWSFNSKDSMTWQQKQDYDERIRKAKKLAEQQKKENQAEAKATAIKIWSQSNPIVGQGHPYLVAKNIQPHHSRLSSRGDLVIPELDENGDIWALQFIKHTPGSEEGEFKKKFLYMGRRDGLFFEIPGSDQVYLCEGFSTGASIAEATGATVICAFNAESLPKVARVLKGLYLGRNITIAADNDQFKAQNTGIKRAKEASKILNNAPVVFPTFLNLETKPTDFNDLAALEGLNAVTIQMGQIGKKIDFPPLSAGATIFKGRVLQRPKPKEFIWNCHGQGFMPRGIVGVLAATGGTGKTFMLLSLGVMTAAGKALGPIESPRAAKTLIICGEDDQDEVERRLWDITKGDFPEYLHAASVYGAVGPLMELDGNKPVRAKGFHWLEETIQNHDGLELLIIDPKSRFYGLDENNNDHATQWIQSLEYFAKEYSLTILISAHTSEANSGKISQSMNRGASALVDGCRWQAGLVRLGKETAEYYGIEKPREYVVLDTPKNNYAADVAKPLYFRRSDNGSLVFCNLKVDSDKAKAECIYGLIRDDPEQYTRRELQRDKDFMADIKDRFKRFKRDDLYPIFDKLITENRIEETLIDDDLRGRLVLKIKDGNLPAKTAKNTLADK